METFFSDAKLWRDGPYPHFLVLLREHPAYQAYARAHRDLLEQHPLGVIPGEWLHATIQGIHHRVSAGQLDELKAAARDELREMEPFSVQIGPVWPGVTAVTAAVYPEDGMTELNRRVRRAAARIPGIAMRPAESRFWAHSTLAYAREEFDDRRLNRALRALRPARVDITIDRVHLVNLHQDPAAGYYTWGVLEEFRLGA
ncbi:2'-5' RNA ligase family protein [Streptomyces natalensis]|uniref:2'-5' RNA ligase n=1 Tax=Streptomyces natalensis ATCC 27448 TaxID=1240678 RepID=A0A0D7CPP4_9ACTN|nr:2'-5' RNA ligase family protein [Streptomyces natalensis]KIZ17377.1 hypothetical protein SNA_12745 [Streptomyces natalensis ATCC 27448]